MCTKLPVTTSVFRVSTPTGMACNNKCLHTIVFVDERLKNRLKQVEIPKESLVVGGIIGKGLPRVVNVQSEVPVQLTSDADTCRV